MNNSPKAAESVTQVDHKVFRGAIAYTSKKSERMDQERGREFYTITVHSEGSRTIVVHTEIDDRPCVMRDATYSLDPDWIPTDCFVRLSVADKFMGTGWFRFTPTYAECETFTAIEGRVTQRFELSAPMKSFQNHAIACDSWHFRHYDMSKGPGQQRIEPFLLCSPDHRGATGPMLYPIGLNMVYVGDEKVTVRAGSFAAHHFQFPGSTELPEEHPPYDIWTTADGEFNFLKGGVEGYMQTWYELVEFEQVV